MSLRRIWRRRQKPTIAQHFSVVTDSVGNLANEIFLAVVAKDLPMPSRATIETALKAFMLEFLESARTEAIKAGKPAAEVEAYADVVTSHAQVAFQTRWAELERSRSEQAQYSGAVHDAASRGFASEA